MSTKKNWLSKDGKYYDTLLEMNSADVAWETQRNEQQQQNELLAEQNRLMQKELDRKNKESEERLEFEREQLEFERKQLELSQEHEEKMRILKLFDSIGLNKRYYDDFINYLASDVMESDNLIDIIEQKEEIDSNINRMKSNLDNPEYAISDYEYCKSHMSKYDSPNVWEDIWYERRYDELSSCYSIDLQAKTISDKFKDYIDKPEKLTERDINNFSSKNDIKRFKELQIKSQNSEKVFKVVLTIWILSLIFAIFGIAMNLDIIAMWALLLFTVIPVIAGIRSKNSPNYHTEMQKIIQHELNNDKSQVLDEKKVIKKWNEIRDKYINQLEELEQKIKTEIGPKWNDFVKFRKKHYNSQFENLLLDLGLKEQIRDLGLDSPKINNSNKVADGTIDDYITYFDSLTSK